MAEGPLVYTESNDSPLFSGESQPFDFVWEFPDGGFAWRRGHASKRNNPSQFFPTDEEVIGELKPDPELALVPLSPGVSAAQPRAFAPSNQQSVGRRRTVPFRDHPSLFRTFASLDPADLDAILAFANKHGPLGVSERVVFESKLIDDATRSSGETHSAWSRAICGMKRTVTFWDLVEQKDIQGLSRWMGCKGIPPESPYDKFLQLRGQGRDKGEDIVITYLEDPEPKGKAWPHWTSNIPREMLALLGLELPEGAGRVLGFSGSVRTDEEAILFAYRGLMLDINDAISRRVETALTRDPSTRQLVLRMYPGNLLSAMWLQFAQAIAGNKQYRQCRHCNNWFEVSSGDDARTARRLFCSDACKSRDYRQRKDRAVALRIEGLTLAVIVERLKAEGLETEADTVKGWVGRKRKGK